MRVQLVTVAVVAVSLLACKQSRRLEEQRSPSTQPQAAVASASAAPAAPEQPVGSVPAADILASYRENQLAADGVYKGKRLRVTDGVVDSVLNGTFGGVDLRIDDGKPLTFGFVTCHFEDAVPALARMRKGDPVQVDGDCNGGTTIGVRLQRCSLP